MAGTFGGKELFPAACLRTHLSAAAFPDRRSCYMYAKLSSTCIIANDHSPIFIAHSSPHAPRSAVLASESSAPRGHHHPH